MTTITQVATFGDSWPAGAELSDNEKTFGEIIANNFNSSFYNGAVGASSADQLIIQLKQFIETEEYEKCAKLVKLKDSIK